MRREGYKGKSKIRHARAREHEYSWINDRNVSLLISIRKYSSGIAQWQRTEYVKAPLADGYIAHAWPAHSKA